MKEIKLTQGKVALVSDKDFKYLSQFKWFAYKNKKNWYAARSIPKEPGKRVQLKMHRVILSVSDPKIQIDHKDNNGLNNQRRNIRICTCVENMRNRLKTKSGITSIYKGVSTKKYYTGAVRWIAQMMINNKKVHLGCFKDELSAALCYNNAAKKHHGKFASLNKINSVCQSNNR